MRFKLLKRILESRQVNKNVNEAKDKLDKIMETSILHRQNTYRKQEVLRNSSLPRPDSKIKECKELKEDKKC